MDNTFRYMPACLAASLSAAVFGAEPTAPFTLHAATVSAGGAVLADGSFVVVGQPVVGTMSNANYTLQVGIVPCFEPRETAPPESGPALWMTFKSSMSVPGIGTVEDEDIVAYHLNSGQWSLILDGSDLGLGGSAIDALARDPDGSILLSFADAAMVPGLIGGPFGLLVDDSDIVRFSPASLGATTAGSFTFYFDGSDVSLTTDSEDIDGLAINGDGLLLISTVGIVYGMGTVGGGEDVLLFTGETGSTTSGTLAMYINSSDLGLRGLGENVDALAVSATGSMYFSTDGIFSTLTTGGSAGDILEFVPITLGKYTTGTLSLFQNLTSMGITFADVTALEAVE